MRKASLSSLPDTSIAVNLAPFRRYLRAKNRAPKTVQTYEEAVRRFGQFLAERGLADRVSAIGREHVEAFMEDLLARGKAASAANRYRSLQAFFKYLVEEGELEESPLGRMSPPRIPEQPPAVLGEEDLRRLLGASSGQSFEDRRDSAILRLMIDTGCRIGEVLGLRWTPADEETNDVDLHREVVRILGKERRWRLVGFGSKAGRALDRYLRLRQLHPDATSPSLWLGRRGPLTDQGLRLTIRKRGEQAGLGRIWPHQLRHSAAHAWLAAGGQEADLMKLMGWTSREMVTRYAASTAAERALAAQKKLRLGDRI